MNKNKNFEQMVDRNLFLRNIQVEEIFDDAEGSEIEYNLNAFYKIVENKEGMVNIKVRAEASFTPEVMFKAKMDFNVLVEYDKSVTDEEIGENIEKIIYPIGAEVSYLLGTITKSMNQTSLIVPPVINKVKILE